mmetsp:Transcript_37920/g.122637  ORF Transcript_37920/g.122637 Transcript_37920/m.122637 type:complete len:257 (-) Transcript_37920:896-1666(-)
MSLSRLGRALQLSLCSALHRRLPDHEPEREEVAPHGHALLDARGHLLVGDEPVARRGRLAHHILLGVRESARRQQPPARSRFVGGGALAREHERCAGGTQAREVAQQWPQLSKVDEHVCRDDEIEACSASEQVGEGHRLEVEREELVVERPLVARRALHAAAIRAGAGRGNPQHLCREVDADKRAGDVPSQVRAGEPGAAARVESGGEGAAFPTSCEGLDRSASHRRHAVLELGEFAVERVRKVVEERLDEARRRL